MSRPPGPRVVRDASGRVLASDPRDPQVQAVYEWERSCVEPLFQAHVLSADQVRAVAWDAAVLMGVRPPQVSFAALPVACHADVQRWRLLVADWGRTWCTVLHEMAHLGTCHLDEPAHGPAFVGMAIALYEAIGGIDGDVVARDAMRRRIAFGPYDAFRTVHQPSRSDGDEGGFAGIDF